MIEVGKLYIAQPEEAGLADLVGQAVRVLSFLGCFGPGAVWVCEVVETGEVLSLLEAELGEETQGVRVNPTGRGRG